MSSVELSVQLRPAIDEPWLSAQSLQCGEVPTGRGTPDHYVCISCNGQPALCAELYVESSFREEAVVVGQSAFVGAGFEVVVVIPEILVSVRVELDSYFGYIYPLSDGALVASGQSLYRVDEKGNVAWVAEFLGADGVVVHKIVDGVVVGEGDFDPPDGWRGFRISLATGDDLLEVDRGYLV